jgi:gluconolactonase
MNKPSLVSGLFIAAITTLGISLPTSAQEPSSIHMQKISGLKMPESVVQGQDGKIYVSEINGFGKDGDGQITVIENGKASVFTSGLDDPKGLVIIGKYLYVADKTKILKIDMQGKAQVFADTNAFPELPLFLNDLEADIAGNLYVSDSGDLNGVGGAIYKINAQGKVSLVLNNKQEPRLLAPNGLLMDDTGDVLTVVDFVSGVLYSINMKTHAFTNLAEGFGGGDGLVHHSSGKMYVSDWKNGKIFSVNLAGEVAEIKAGYQSAADIALTRDEQYLMVPDMKAGELDFISLH